MLFPLRKPARRSQLMDEIEMVVQVRMNPTEAVELRALPADVAGPAARQAFALRTLPDGAVRLSTPQPAWFRAAQLPHMAQDGEKCRVIFEFFYGFGLQRRILFKLQLLKDFLQPVHQQEKLPPGRNAIGAAEAAV